MNSPTPDVWLYMAILDRPQLRPLSLVRFDHQGRSYALVQDSLRVSPAPVLVPLEVFLPICRHFDGRLSLEEIRRRVEGETGEPLHPEALDRLVAQLDRAMVPGGPTFASFLDSYHRLLEARVRRFDHEILGHAAAVDPARWFATVASVSDRFRVCGLAVAYATLYAIGPARGESGKIRPGPGRPQNLRRELHQHGLSRSFRTRAA